MGAEVVQTTGAVPVHPALLDYACVDALVRPALGLPPHDGPPDAFTLALAVGLLFQRFVNACSVAHVDSTEPWMHALAFSDKVLSAPFQAPLSLGEARFATPIPTSALTLSADKLEETPGAPSQHARLCSSPRKPVSGIEPVTPKSDGITDPAVEVEKLHSSRSRPSHPSTPRKSLKKSATPARRAPEGQHAGPSNAPVSPALDELRPHIRAILAAPDNDWKTFSVKCVRQRLVARAIPGITAEWAGDNKARLKPVIEEEFDAFAARQERAEQLQPSPSPIRDAASISRMCRFGPVSVKSEMHNKYETFDTSSRASPSPFPLSVMMSSSNHAPRRATNKSDHSARGLTLERDSRGISEPFPLAPGRAAVYSPTAAGSSANVRPHAVPGAAGEDAPHALKPRVPPLSARREAQKIRAPSPASAQAASTTPVPASAGQKRARSATPDSDEDEFAASFMRKRKVSSGIV